MSRHTLVLQTREQDGTRATLALGAAPALHSTKADPDGRWGFGIIALAIGITALHPAAWHGAPCTINRPQVRNRLTLPRAAGTL